MVDPNTYPDPPPRLTRLLSWLCADRFWEEVSGDLHEQFLDDTEAHGVSYANRHYLLNALRYVTPFFISQTSAFVALQPAMLKHHLKISTRHLLRQRFYSLINVSGLAVGLACCLMIVLFVRHELSYDQQFADADRLYRVIDIYESNNSAGIGSVTPTPLASTMADDFPEVEHATRIAPQLFEAGSSLVRTTQEPQNRYETGFVYADPNFFEVFDFPFVQGLPGQALAEPRTLVLTERKARDLFPGQDPVGQTLILNNNIESPFTVTGVLADLPSNTHFRFDYLMSMAGVEIAQIPNWGFSNFITYAKLHEGADADAVNAKFPAFTARHRGTPQPGHSATFSLQPVPDVHLHSSDMRGYWTHGNIQYVWLFGAIAAFILLIAAINFMNLSTARSANRAREIGLRKVLGSVRAQVIAQFLVEAVVLSAIAMGVAVALVALVLPWFNGLTDQSLTMPWGEAGVYPMLLATVLALGLLAGAYPALYLSGFQPIRVLKGRLSMGSKSGTLRSALVVFQFAASIVLLIGSLVVSQQMGFLQNKALGFEKDQVLIVEDSFTLGEQAAAFKAELERLPGVQRSTVSSFVPVDGYVYNGSGAWVEGQDPAEDQIGLAKWFVDPDYAETLGLELVAGRFFDADRPSDAQGTVLNEQAVADFGFGDPIGQRVRSYTRLDPETGELVSDVYTVIGVVKDFHFQSMKDDIGPLSMVAGQGGQATLVKLSTDEVQATLAQIETLWAGFAPNQPFRFNFLDERFAQMYTFESRVGRLFGVFTALAMLVACLGLFALAAFMTEQRRQEVGIRKVLGASLSQIVFLLTRHFAMLVGLAFMVAAPLGYLLMNRWLQDFSYHTSISIGVFIVAGVAALGIAVLTISYQATRAALTNPAETLRQG
ncbi:MAG: ABC transporter permease [Rhodothermales bacterium]